VFARLHYAYGIHFPTQKKVWGEIIEYSQLSVQTTIHSSYLYFTLFADPFGHHSRNKYLIPLAEGLFESPTGSRYLPIQSHKMLKDQIEHFIEFSFSIVRLHYSKFFAKSQALFPTFFNLANWISFSLSSATRC
jgi:hypothetical protein